MSKFERLLNIAPFDWEEAVASGVAYLAEELEARNVKFEVAENGVRIGIVCDEENQRKAAIFWKNYVQPALEGDK
jgi:hypothetical protein